MKAGISYFKGIKNRFCLALLISLFTISAYSQLLPEAQAEFSSLKAYEKTGDNPFGKLVRETTITAKVIVMNIDNDTAISFESSLFSSGGQMFIVRNVDKNIEDNVSTYFVESFNMLDPDKKNVQFIIEYTEKKIRRFILLTNDNTAVFY